MLKERVVVITGAAGGIGALLVKQFLANSDMVIATDMTESGLAALCKECEGSDRLLTVTADLSAEEGCEKVAAMARASVGRVDVLVNCAGYFPLQPFEKITPADWRRIIDINLNGVFYLTRFLLPLIKGRGWGRIINIGSGSFFKGSPNQAHYVAAKAGVVGLTRSLATEMGKYGITVNVVTPGLTVTAAVKRTMSEEFLEANRLSRPLQRHQYAEDLGGAVLFLASPASDFMTGQILNVDGGSVKH